MSIVLEGLSKRFGGAEVVDRVSLEIAEEKLFVLLGASGSGKSSILRMIAGLSMPDEGRILLNGKDVTYVPPQARGIGLVFQNYSIFRHMSVRENVEFGLKIRKVPRAERRRRQEELLDLIGLSGLGDRYAHQLSGGQQQRVALARALAYQPAVLLLDEPFGALDVKIRAQLRRSFKEIKDRLGVTTLLVTHDQEEAFELADRIGVIEKGRLLEVGKPEVLYRTPRTLFVATFLGAGTVLAGRAEKGKAVIGPLSLDIPGEVPHGEGESVRCLFRPEEVLLTSDKPNDKVGVLGQGIIAERWFCGAVQRLRLLLPKVAGVRQVAPVTPFGEEGLIVDAVAPAEAVLPPGSPWVSLRSWHILSKPELRILIGSSGDGSEAALSLGSQLCKDLNATANLLGTASDSNEAESLRGELKKRQESHGLAHCDVVVRHGDTAAQILKEQNESIYELTVLGGRNGHGGKLRRLGPTLLEVLERSSQSVLVAKGDVRRIASLLICTSADESGKSDVLAGGRLARLLDAKVTLLHVAPPNGDLDPLVRRHLDKAVASLRAMDLTVDLRARFSHNVLRGIIEEAKRTSPDVIVVGSHATQFRALYGLNDLTRKLASISPVSVLVAPAEEV